MRIFILTTAFFVFINNLLSDDLNGVGKEYANSLNVKFGGIGSTTDPNIVPGYKGADVPETQYYARGSNFENIAKADAQKNETNSYLRNASDKRPSIKIDPKKDPLFKRYDEITDQSHALSENYKGCKKLPVGTNDVTKYNQKSCFEYGRRDEITFQCDRQLEVHCTNKNAGQDVGFGAKAFTVSGPAWAKKDQGTNIHFGSEGNDRSGGCVTFTNTISFNLKRINDIVDFRIENFTFDDWITISLNGTTLYSEPFTQCERGQIFSKPGFDLKPYLKKGNNVLTVVNVVAGGGHAWINLKAVKKVVCEEKEKIIYSCDNNQNYLKATLLKRRCTEGPSVKKIKGTKVARDCWHWIDSFTDFDSPVYTKDSLCNELIQNGCGYTSNHCVEEDPTYCKKREFFYSCPHQESEKFVEICGDQLVCPDGKCTKEYQEYKPSTEDLKKAVTAMEVAKMLTSELKQDHLSVFKGSNKTCKEEILGFKNCCKDKGWGMNLGISECSSDEKELGMAREAGKAHFVGFYKTGKALNRKKYQSFCIYPSKLARIINEQGKGQLGRSFGEARSPDCSGFSLAELEKLNFDKINFSEFESEALSKITTENTPGVASSIGKFKEAIEQRLKKE